MKITVYDIETLKECFLFLAYIEDGNKWMRFAVNQWENSIDGMVNFLKENQDYYFVGFNNLRFDSQVVEWIVRNHHKWHDLKGLEICRLIWQKAQDIIDDANYEVFPQYREYQLTNKQMDLFTIFHYNNENRRTSLKALEFSMRMENIEEMPINHDHENLTQQDILQIDSYCKNDVLATYEFYKIARGNTSNPLYKGKDKIQDRINMKEEFGLDCMNWDDVKIGAEWNKLDYLNLSGKREDELKPKKVIHFFGKKFKNFIPPYIKFQTKEMRNFVEKIAESYVLNKKQEFKFDFDKIRKMRRKLIATIAKGGIHSCEKGRWIIPQNHEIYLQIDVGSQYPNAIRKLGVEPPHLKGWNGLIVSKIDRRLNYKKKYKETGDPKYNSLQEMGKLSLNGGSLTKIICI